MRRSRAILIWTALGFAIAVPLTAAALSPLLAWRQPIYILAGFAGVVAMTLLLLQPLLIGNLLPGLGMPRSRLLHKVTGAILVLTVVVHVAGLWITSPPDVIDALLFASPTPFSAWGVIAMWAVFAAALLALLRRRLNLRLATWRRVHSALALATVIGSVVHALLIEGTMEFVSKALLCALALAATIKVVIDLRIWARRARRGRDI